MRARRLAVLLLLIAAAPGSAQAPLPLPRLSGPIVLDGRVGEPAWERVAPLPATMQQPTFQGEPTEATEFRVAYDDEAIYLSCRAYDSEPALVLAPSLQRDENSFTNDWCVLQLDTFNDKEVAVLFGTSPAGIRTEGVFYDDGSAPNFTWNAFWDARATQDERGWYAEIRVPFSSLRFQEAGADGVVMGLAVWRLIARKNEVLTWPAISPRWGMLSFSKASQFREVRLDGIRPTRALYVTPYGLTGTGRSHVLDEAGRAFRPASDDVLEGGADVKYGLTSNLTLDVTLNTDFAQVEADEQQVNLTRFSLFFPEKRLFFQERASVFDFSLGDNERLFHSRRIGLVNGEQIRIYGGARVVGRLGEWDVGVLDMQAGPALGLSSENLGVLRARRRVVNQNSYVGGIVTTRTGNAPTENIVYGLDGLFRVAEQDYVSVAWAGSFGGVSEGAYGERTLGRVLWERRGIDGLVYSAEAVRAGAGFEPGLGYLRRRDYLEGSGSLGYGWRPSAASRLLRHTLQVDGSAFRRNEDGRIESVLVEPEWVFELKSGQKLTGRVSGSYEDLEERFSVSADAGVPAGTYRFASGSLQYDPRNASLLRTSFRVEAGGFYDGRITSLSASPTWNLSRHLELTGTYRLDDVRFAERGERFTAHTGRVRAEVRLDTRLSGVVFAQYSSAGDALSTNVRLRYNPSEGHDLYLVWNEGLNTDRLARHPAQPLWDRRTVLLKYSRTLTLGL